MYLSKPFNSSFLSISFFSLSVFLFFFLPTAFFSKKEKKKSNFQSNVATLSIFFFFFFWFFFGFFLVFCFEQFFFFFFVYEKERKKEKERERERFNKKEKKTKKKQRKRIVWPKLIEKIQMQTKNKMKEEKKKKNWICIGSILMEAWTTKKKQEHLNSSNADPLVRTKVGKETPMHPMLKRSLDLTLNLSSLPPPFFPPSFPS